MMLPPRKKKKGMWWCDVLQLALIASLLRPPLHAGPKPLLWYPQPVSTDILAYLVEHPNSPSSQPPPAADPPRPAPDQPAAAAAEPSPTDLSQEDLELIEILWRQDVDLGVSRPGPSSPESEESEESKSPASPVPVDLETGEPLLPIPELEDLDLDLEDLPSPLSLCWDGMLDELDSKSGEMYPHASAWPPEPSSSAGMLVGAGTSLSGPPKVPTNQTHFNLFDASPLIHQNTTLYTPEPYPPSAGGPMDSFFQSDGDFLNLDLNTTVDHCGSRKAMEDMGLYMSPGEMGFPRHSPLSTSADSAVCSLDSESSLPSEDTFKFFSPQHYPPVSAMHPQGFKVEPPFISLQQQQQGPDFPFPHPSSYLEPPAYPPTAFYHNHTYSLPGPVLPHTPKSSPSSKDNKDAARLQEAGIPLSVEDVVNLPMDDYTEKIANLGLTDHQLNILKDIRRRGKNKVAAQNCRKRKLDQIHVLSDSLHQLLAQEEEAKRTRVGLLETRRAFEQAVDKLQRFIVGRVHVHNQLRTASTAAAGSPHK